MVRFAEDTRGDHFESTGGKPRDDTSKPKPS